jgi:hypothetical protein
VDGFFFTSGALTPAPTLPFADVHVGAWFYPAVYFVFDNQLFSGTAANMFSFGTGVFIQILI